MPEEPDKNIIKEIITHLNTLEEKLKTLNDGIKEAEDLVTVNKLDIINLKNEIEKIKLSIPEVSLDTLNKLKELEKITASTEQIEKWKRLEKDVGTIKTRMEEKEGGRMDDVIAGLEIMNQRVMKLESDISDIKTKKHKEHAEAIGKLSDKVKTIEKTTSRITHCPGCGGIVTEKAKFCSKCGKKL